jgi:hypothetical protein
MASVAQLAQAIPAMAMQGGDPTEVVGKLGVVIQRLQKGDTIENAIEEAFPPPPPPEPAPEAPGAPGQAAPPSAQPQQAPPAAGASGAPAEGGPANDLLMALAGTGPTGNPNLSFAVSKRRPV